MKLKTSYESEDEIPSGYAELFTERNGRWELTGIEGMKTQDDINRLQTGLSKERDAHKETKEKLRAYSALGDDPEEVLSKLDRIAELEAAAGGKLDEGALNKMVESRIGARLGPVERERDRLKSELDSHAAVIADYKGKEVRRTISGAITEAAKKAGVSDGAVEDAVMWGQSVFELSEDGQVVAREGAGVTQGVDPSVWLSDMQAKKPHWWGTTTGGGATGGRNTGGNANNPFSAEHWNMTEQGKMVTENRQRAEQMAKQAGTTIGGGRPAAKA